MVTKSDVIRKVGEQTYLDACASARRDAARSDYGRGMGWGEPLADIPHQVTDLIWDGDWPWRDKLRLFFEIYDDMPAYGHLMYVPHHYSHFSQADNQEWWAGVRARLASGDPALAQPLAYSLWCDFFEHPDRVEQAWSELSGESVPEPALRIVLLSSGPVPYPLKRRVYDRLIADPGWHGAIFQSLLNSAFDVFGQIDARDACELLTRLRPGPDTEQLATLRDKLGCSRSWIRRIARLRRRSARQRPSRSAGRAPSTPSRRSGA